MSEVANVEAQSFAKNFKRVEGQIRAALPSHISFERFERTVMVAVQKEPRLLECDQRSLFLEIQKCAADGLTPDGREAVLTVRWNSKLGRNVAVYQPMVAGLMKLARNSGEILSLHAEIVYKGEKFAVVLGDEPRIEHERNVDLVDAAPPIAVYAVALLKSGEKQREVLTAKQVENIRNVNRDWAKGPWGGPFASEMWRKSAIRRLYKRLPSSTDRDGDDRFGRAVERVESPAIDGQAEDLTDQAAAPAAPASRDRPSRLDALEAQLAAQPAPAREVDPETGEVSAAAPDDGSAGLIAHIEACPSFTELDDLSKQPLFVEWRELNKQINPAGVRRVGAAFTKREQELAAKKNG